MGGGGGGTNRTPPPLAKLRPGMGGGDRERQNWI